MTSQPVKIIECPRDAWQGLPRTIPTAEKAGFHRLLMAAGFRHLDAVSFVSPKHVPQMADSEQVLQQLFPEGPPAREVDIIGIVVNRRGAERAIAAPGVTTLGYPHSLSDGFLRQNQNLSVEESRQLVAELREMAEAAGRNLVVYLSMAFGNPYGEPWDAGRVVEEASSLWTAGIRSLSLADTVGRAQAREVGDVYAAVSRALPEMEIGVHLHSRPETAAEKILAAREAGCKRFDSALGGLGGCPFAGDELVGNLPTETVVETLEARGLASGIDRQKLAQALETAREIRHRYGSHAA